MSLALWISAKNDSANRISNPYLDNLTFKDLTGIDAGNSSGYYLDAVNQQINNYEICTWNPSDVGSGLTLSNGNLTVFQTLAATHRMVRATHGFTSGKHIFAFNWDSGSPGHIGVSKAAAALTSFVGASTNGWSFGPDGNKYTNGSGSAHGPTVSAGDTGVCSVEPSAGKVYFGVQRAADTIAVNTGTDVITRSSHGLSVGSRVWFRTSGTLPGGLSDAVLYYVKTAPDGNTFTVSTTSGGSTVDITSSGSGTHYLGKWLGAADPEAGTNAAFSSGLTGAALYPSASLAAQNATLTANFGASTFPCPVPSGFSVVTFNPGNMTLRTTAVSAAAAPSFVTVLARYDDPNSDVTLNTDVVFSVSRDGGTTFSAVTMSLVANIGTDQIVMGTVDVSGQPSGTSIVMKVTTPGSEKVELMNLSAQWPAS